MALPIGSRTIHCSDVLQGPEDFALEVRTHLQDYPHKVRPGCQWVVRPNCQVVAAFRALLLDPTAKEEEAQPM